MSVWLAQQLRQLGDVGGDAPCLVAGEEVRGAGTPLSPERGTFGDALANQISMEYPPRSPILLRSINTLVFKAGRRSINLDHPVGTMATNANLALAEVRTQNFLDARLRCAVTAISPSDSIFSPRRLIVL